MTNEIRTSLTMPRLQMHEVLAFSADTGFRVWCSNSIALRLAGAQDLHVYTYRNMHTYMVRLHIYGSEYVYIFTYRYMHTCTYAYTHACVYASKYYYIDLHVHTYSRSIYDTYLYRYMVCVYICTNICIKHT